MKKRFIAGLFCICMVVCLLPTTSHAISMRIKCPGTTSDSSVTRVVVQMNSLTTGYPNTGTASIGDPNKILPAVEASTLSVNIPALVNDGLFYKYKPVEVATKAFVGSTNLQSVTIASADVIGNEAFKDCTSLKTVDFPAATHIQRDCFAGCTSLETVKLPKASEFPDNLLGGLVNLKEVDMSSALSVKQNMLANCTSIKNVSFPSATIIYSGAFSGCTSLERVDLIGTKRVGEAWENQGTPFDKCTSLKCVVYGDMPNWQSTVNLYRDCPTDLVSYYKAGNPTWTGDDITGTSPNRKWKDRKLCALGTVNVTGGSFSFTPDSPVTGLIPEGASVTITANPDLGQDFRQWKTDVPVEFTSGSATSDSATFTMPSTNVNIMAEKAYEITSGQNGEWTKGSTEGLSFTANGEFSKFKSISVDGADISSDDYTVESGSGIVTLKPSYLQNLSPEKHELKINYNDGYADTSFTVKKRIYTITNGQNSEWAKGSKENLSFTSDAEFTKFASVLVDDNTVDVNNYTAQSGSTIVTLKSGYLQTLSIGTHTLQINSSDGYAKTSFTVKLQNRPNNPNGSTDSKDSNNPTTGDINSVALWIALLLISGGVAAGVVTSKRRKIINK